MADPSNAIQHVSDTALWGALYRAIESERPDALFHDPYARRLAGERGARIFDGVPKARTWGWPMIVRTAVMSVVSPPGVTVFASAPASSSRRRIAALPFIAATWMGVTPYRVTAFTSAPRLMSVSTVFKSLARTA